jgi:hypothetical protein
VFAMSAGSALGVRLHFLARFVPTEKRYAAHAGHRMLQNITPMWHLHSTQLLPLAQTTPYVCSVSYHHATDTQLLLSCCPGAHTLPPGLQIYLQMVVQQQDLQPGVCRRGERPPATVRAGISDLYGPTCDLWQQQAQSYVMQRMHWQVFCACKCPHHAQSLCKTSRTKVGACRRQPIHCIQPICCLDCATWPVILGIMCIAMTSDIHLHLTPFSAPFMSVCGSTPPMQVGKVADWSSIKKGKHTTSTKKETTVRHTAPM